MTFEEILPAVKSGRKAQRAVWDGRGTGWRGCWLELTRPSLADGRTLMPLLAIGYPDEGMLRPFAGANWDLLADDWELV